MLSNRLIFTQHNINLFVRNGPTEHDSKDNNNKAKTETPQYEDVGPALPPMRKSASKPVLPGSKIPLTVKNILYTTADELNSGKLLL